MAERYQTTRRNLATRLLIRHARGAAELTKEERADLKRRGAPEAHARYSEAEGVDSTASALGEYFGAYSADMTLPAELETRIGGLREALGPARMAAEAVKAGLATKAEIRAAEASAIRRREERPEIAEREFARNPNQDPLGDD